MFSTKLLKDNYYHIMGMFLFIALGSLGKSQLRTYGTYSRPFRCKQADAL